MGGSAADPAAGQGDDGRGIDDLPETHLDDEAYEEFLAREMDSDGRLRDSGPPVVGLLILAIVVILAVAVLALGVS